MIFSWSWQSKSFISFEIIHFISIYWAFLSPFCVLLARSSVQPSVIGGSARFLAVKDLTCKMLAMQAILLQKARTHTLTHILAWTHPLTSFFRAKVSYIYQVAIAPCHAMSISTGCRACQSGSAGLSVTRCCQCQHAALQPSVLLHSCKPWYVFLFKIEIHDFLVSVGMHVRMGKRDVPTVMLGWTLNWHALWLIPALMHAACNLWVLLYVL